SRGASPLHMARHLSINAVSLRLASSARPYIALAASKSRLDTASIAGFFIRPAKEEKEEINKAEN
ncbi:hypothetical protein, partial [Acetomicrobium sp. S15 = DSM 107314]|uniref:hypothetical protein n=1 Tax=Acetomicrobium sp. S15 = DSM 107314 TaxID=2529858 RepID=UPI001E5F91ED